VIDAAGQHLRLAELVEVDVREVISLATWIVDDRSAGPSDLESAQQLIGSAGDLLPDWYEDWVQYKREHLRQLRLHALEALCERLTRAGRYGMAVQSGLAAVACEPLRESAHRALMRAYAAEGNHGEALRQYRTFRRLLHQELHLEPSRQMELLIQQIRTAT
jgi:DNA-binding SARP family transcriptional activator